MSKNPREAQRIADMDETELKWTAIANKQLQGRTITKVRYLTKIEAEKMGWSDRCVVLQLDNGNLLLPSSDDEGNNAGALFTQDKEHDVLPVIN